MNATTRMKLAWVVAALFGLATALYLIAGITGGWDTWMIVAVILCPIAAVGSVLGARHQVAEHAAAADPSVVETRRAA